MANQYSKNGPRKDRTSTHGSDYSSKNRSSFKSSPKAGVGGPAGYSMLDALAKLGAPKKSANYGQGKHSKGGKGKQSHW